MAAKTVKSVDNYIQLEKLGEGTYGVVFKAKHKKTGDTVAMKRIRLDCENDGIPSSAIREITFLKDLDHPNIVGLKDVLLTNGKLNLVFEIMAMDLRMYLDSGKPMDPPRIKNYAQQILQGLAYCHKRRILHRDIKPQNLLLNDKGCLKLADFGLARLFGTPVRIYTHQISTLFYRAPELLLEFPDYSTPVDIWSVGTVVSEMALRIPIFKGENLNNQIVKIFETLGTPTEETWPGISQNKKIQELELPVKVSAPLPSLLSSCEESLLSLITQLFHLDPAVRITSQQALEHPYFNT